MCKIKIWKIKVKKYFVCVKIILFYKVYYDFIYMYVGYICILFLIVIKWWYFRFYLVVIKGYVKF